METLNAWITSVNDVLWTYILIGVLLGCAAWFTIRTKGVQFRMFGEMIRLLGESAASVSADSRASACPKLGSKLSTQAGPAAASKRSKRQQVSSFQAFAVSLASRVGTGNLAGVATAIAVGGPGAVFWMWIIALLGASSSFVESTLAQLYKRRSKDSFVGGPAYYMETGLGRRGMGVIFAVLMSVTFGLAFNSVQSNTICAAWESAFGLNRTVLGIILAALTLVIICGGIRSIARVSSMIVPVMALGYVGIAFVVVLMNVGQIPDVIRVIIGNAFGLRQAVAGGVGAALMQGIRRGLFSNEAGMGSAPNAAATATTSHPVKQGLIQTLGVFTDTLLVCSCTAFIILCSGAPIDGSLNGVQLTQTALSNEIGSAGSAIVAVTILLLAFSSIIGNSYYGEANIRFITDKKWVLTAFRVCVGAMVMFGALTSLDVAWNLADVTMGLIALVNFIAVVQLGPQAFRLLDDYLKQKKAGTDPVFKKETMPDISDKIECW